jgi:copper chaperone CopZ
MKNFFLSVLALICINASANAQSRTDTIYAKGNCGHCQERIETTVMAIKGVSATSWDPTFSRLVCTYDAALTNNTAIQKVIASVGHDTDMFRADDKVYKNLPGCCKYERDPVESKETKIQTFEFVIEGMTCAEGCAKGIELSVLKQKGIKSSVVNYDTKRAKVIFDSSKISKEKIIEIVEGFRPEGEAPHYKVMPIK